MSVFFWTPRKKWVVQWVAEGQKKRKYFLTEQEANDFEDERIAPTEDQSLTLGELVALFFRSNPDKHQSTKSKIVNFLAGREEGKRHIDGCGEFLRDKFAEKLTRRDLEVMREAVRATGSCNNTINKYQAYIRAILAWGVDQQLITFNPWRDFKRLPVKKYIVGTTLEDFRIILLHCPDWLKWAFATAYALAMRPGIVELFSLPWSSFNWKFGYVQYAQGKSGAIKRVYPPQSYMVQARFRYEEDMSSGIPWVCHRNGKKVLSYNSAWRTALKDSGMQGRGIRPYDIRHIAASEMLAAGADLAAVAAQMGHASCRGAGNLRMA